MALFKLGCRSSLQRWTKGHSRQLCIDLHCEIRRTKRASNRNLWSFRQHLSCNFNKEVDRLVVKDLFPVLLLTSLVLDKAVDGLKDLAFSCLSLFALPMFWSSCLIAKFAPLQHQPLDVHCLESPLFPSLFWEGTTGIALSSTRPDSACTVMQNRSIVFCLLLGLHSSF